MSNAWDTVVNLDEHDAAWERAKIILGVSDIRVLNLEQFRGVIALAESIRRGEYNNA
jgi:hypothetical protein